MGYRRDLVILDDYPTNGPNFKAFFLSDEQAYDFIICNRIRHPCPHAEFTTLNMTGSAYTPIARFFHWLTAAFLLANFLFGLSLENLPLSPIKLQRIAWHKWTGITILGLVSMRLIYRLLVKPPPPEPGPEWQLKAARLVHGSLYFLMFAIPFSGWCLSSAAGIPVVYLSLWELPALLPKNKAWVDGLKGLHLGLNVSMAVLVSVHVLAALKHHITDRDLTLVRMLPILKRHS